jgi:predicted CxxxxCH...CXXCH cytochrome family protein
VLRINSKWRFIVVHKFMRKWFFLLLPLVLFTACGGGSDTTMDLSTGGTVTQGIAVDPYIVGGIFQEIESQTGIVLQQSSPSDEAGMFSFELPLTPGSIVELVPNTGLHGGAPYQGILRRVVAADDDGPVVVSPLTTLLANGMTPAELIAAFNDAGLAGITASDLYDDPMAGLADKTTEVTDEDLRLLQASMAANAYMEVTGDYQAGMNGLNDSEHFQIFSAMLKAMENLLNPEEFAAIKAALADDPDMTGPPILQDFVRAVVVQQQTIVTSTRENMQNNGTFNQAMVDQAVLNVMGNGTAMVKDSYSQRVPLSDSYDGVTLYHDNCSACHSILDTTEIPGSSAADIQTAIDNNYGGMGMFNTLTPGEVAAIAEVLPAVQTPAPGMPVPTPTPTPDPTLSPDGIALYGTNCSGCHKSLDTTAKPGRSAAQIQAAIDSNRGGMGMLSGLTPDEVQAIADALSSVQTSAPGMPVPAPTPTPDPTLPPDGIALYVTNCSNCHGLLDTTAKPGRSAAEIQAAIDSNLGGMGILSGLTPDEVQAIADALPPAPVIDPTLPPDGIALYGTDCSSCHGPLDTTAKPGRSAAQIQAAIDSNLGGMGMLSGLTPGEVQAIAEVLPQDTGSAAGPDYSDCTLCHGQPPSGTSYPDTAGAHAVHTALASVGGDCTICHLGAAHNSQVDLGFPDTFDAKSGPATDNLDGTCSSVKCHGGQTTPDWWSGSIAVDTQCTSCHSSGTSQYNSYSSGRHSKHVNGEGFSCTVCHNTDALGNGHFSNLETSGFELDPAATVGGGSTRVGSYSNGTCSSIACHGSQRW